MSKKKNQMVNNQLFISKSLVNALASADRLTKAYEENKNQEDK